MTAAVRLVLVTVIGLLSVVGPVSAQPAAPALPHAMQPTDDPNDDPRVTPVVRAYRKASPAVVNISTTQVVHTRRGLLADDLFDRVFPAPPRRMKVQSLGSGVIVHPSGLIVTNAHVVRRAQQIEVTLADERSFDARVISVQADYDLAVLEIDADKLLPHLPLGRSDDLMVGETVIAIGNPLGYAGSLTTGVVSALDRKLEFDSDLAYEGLIQTDAPINPGNSGGPLLNVRGELIGVNTAIRADAQNIGFAIPADTVAAELVDLLDFEQLNRVMFGATVRHRRLDGAAVTEVTNVAADSPADNRLREGDRIVAVDGQPVRQVCDFLAPMMAVRAGETVHLTVQRGDRRKDVAVQIKARPRPDGKALARKLLGMSVREITPQLARDLRLSLPRGLLVVGIDAGGPADRAGIELKDILFQVNQVYCRDADELGAALDEVTPGEGVRVGIVRGRVAAWAAVRTAGEE